MDGKRAYMRGADQALRSAGHSEGIRLLKECVASLRRAICVAAAIVFASGPGALPALGQSAQPSATPWVPQGSFSYDFRAPGTGTTVSGPTLSFSNVQLYNVSQGPSVSGGTVFGPFPNYDPTHFIAFGIFAPSGYIVEVDTSSLYVPVPQAGAAFTVSSSGTSQWITVRFSHNPAVSDYLLLGNLTGRFTLRKTYALTVNQGSGTGDYLEGQIVKVTANAPAAGQEFAGWTGDIAILSNPFIATTTAIIPAMAVSITATSLGSSNVSVDGDKWDRGWRLSRRQAGYHRRGPRPWRPAVRRLARECHFHRPLVGNDYIDDAFLRGASHRDLLYLDWTGGHRTSWTVLQ